MLKHLLSLVGCLFLLCHPAASRGDWQTDYYYYLDVKLIPDATGSVKACDVGAVFKFGPGMNRKDYVDYRPSAKAIQIMCAYFKNLKVEVHRTASGEVQSQDAPWPCYVYPAKPDAPVCRPIQYLPTD